MRAEKNSMISEVERRLSAAGCVYLIDYTRQDTARIAEMRRKLRGVGAEMHVVANRMLRIVADKLGWKGMDGRIRKPTAVITGSDDVATARIVQEFAVLEEKPIGITGGFLEGQFVSKEEVVSLSKMPSREALLGSVVGTIAAPMTGLVGILHRKLGSIVYVLKAAEQKKT